MGKRVQEKDIFDFLTAWFMSRSDSEIFNFHVTWPHVLSTSMIISYCKCDRRRCLQTKCRFFGSLRDWNGFCDWSNDITIFRTSKEQKKNFSCDYAQSSQVWLPSKKQLEGYSLQKRILMAKPVISHSLMSVISDLICLASYVLEWNIFKTSEWTLFGKKKIEKSSCK